MVVFKNSAVLRLGRRPKLKSAEFLNTTILYHEILRCENLDFGCECYTYWDPDPASGMHTTIPLAHAHALP